MNHKILLICGAILLLIFVIGCTQVQTCSQQKGDSCEATDGCEGSWTKASDVSLCCIGDCITNEDSTENNPKVINDQLIENPPPTQDNTPPPAQDETQPPNPENLQSEVPLGEEPGSNTCINNCLDEGSSLQECNISCAPDGATPPPR